MGGQVGDILGGEGGGYLVVFVLDTLMRQREGWDLGVCGVFEGAEADLAPSHGPEGGDVLVDRNQRRSAR